MVDQAVLEQGEEVCDLGDVIVTPAGIRDQPGVLSRLHLTLEVESCTDVHLHTYVSIYMNKYNAVYDSTAGGDSCYSEGQKTILLATVTNEEKLKMTLRAP
jgi:uridine phosphorylase